MSLRSTSIPELDHFKGDPDGSSDRTEDDNDDELWLSGHRSIFSSYGIDHPSISSSLDNDDFHRQLPNNQRYHRFVFGQEQSPVNLSEWSMHFSANPKKLTSWKSIKIQTAISPSEENSNKSKTITLYQLFQQNRHVNEKSFDNALNEKLESKLTRPTTFSKLKFHKSSKDRSSPMVECSTVDQCLQTSFHHSSSTSESEYSSGIRHFQPTSSSSSSHQSLVTFVHLPDLHFLNDYTNENRTSIPVIVTPVPRICVLNKPKRTIFYCRIKRANYLEALKNPTTLFTGNQCKEIPSPICSSTENSTSSSGYFSSPTHPRPLSIAHPLKSCLKHRKCQPVLTGRVLNSSIAGDLFTSTCVDKIDSTRKPRPVHWTVSENDLRTKKSVSFCHEIVRRLIITPKTSDDQLSFLRRTNHRYLDDCDSVPRESLTESPPNEFRLSDEDTSEDQQYQPMNFVESNPSSVHKNLIETFAATVLKVLEIKCANSQSDYLTNLTNPELEDTLRYKLCPLIRSVLEHGLRQHSSSLFTRKINLWRLIDSTMTNDKLVQIAKSKIPTTHDWIEKFNGFIYELLNFRRLASWFNEFLSYRDSFENYYEPSSLMRCGNADFFERLANHLEKLSPLLFRVKYALLTDVSCSSSATARRFHPRYWL